MLRPIIEDERCGELWITLLTSSHKAREKQTHHSAVIELSQCVIFTLSQPLIAPVPNTAKFQVQFLVSKDGEILDSEDMEVVPEYLVELVRKAAVAEYQKQEKNK